MSGKPITFGRYQKVEAILEADRAIKAKLGAKTEIVCRPPPSNEKAYFSKPVVYITEMLHASGVDAHTTSKTDVLKAALKLLQDGDGQFSIPAHVAAPAPEPAAPELVREVKKPKAEKPKVEKSKVEKPKAPVVVAAPKPVARKAGSGLAKAPAPTVKKAVEPKKDGKAAPKDEPVSAKSRSEAGATFMPSERTKALADPSVPYAYGVSLVTLLMTADQIAEAHDRAAGRKERQSKLADLIREYQALTVIPKGAKETSPSTE